jgi:Tfp pilus assembly protein PilN
MITLDLLPSKEKKSLNWDAWRRLVMVFGLGGLASLFLFCLMLVGINFYLSWNLEKMSASLDLHRRLPSGEEIRLLEEQLTAANQKLNQISKIRAKISPQSWILAEMAGQIPPNIAILSLKIKNGGLVELTGWAKDRPSLLALKKAFENNPKISQFNFPLSNLLQEANFSFSLSFRISQL